MTSTFDPAQVNLDTADPREIICYLNAGENDYDGRLGARVGALFVILVVSSLTTLFPVVAARVPRLRVNIYVYLFARYFGAGVILATAFIHLLDPAYSEIGPQTCVGMTGHWADYSWVPAIMLTTIMAMFLLEFGTERYVDHKYGLAHTHPNVETLITHRQSRGHAGSLTHQQLHSGDQDSQLLAAITSAQKLKDAPTSYTTTPKADVETGDPVSRPLSKDSASRSFNRQITAFLILEIGIIIHSVIIGLNLGTTGSEFSTLYPVLVFHQAFEGLGLGARLSTLPFPPHLTYLPFLLSLLYGLTTPIAIAVGLAVRTSYNAGSFTANVVSGVLDSVSAGVLIYTGLVELLARDFLFNAELTREKGRLWFMIACVFLGAGLMALLGKWA